MSLRPTRPAAITTIVAAVLCTGLTVTLADEPPMVSGRFGYPHVRSQQQTTATTVPRNSPVQQPANDNLVVDVVVPEANSSDEFWSLVSGGKSAISEVTDDSEFVTIRVPRESVRQEPQTQSIAQPRPRPAETQTPTRPAQVPLPTQQNPKVATVSSQQQQQQPAGDSQFVTIRVPREFVHQAAQAQPITQPAATQISVRPARVPLPTQRNPKVATISSQQQLPGNDSEFVTIRVPRGSVRQEPQTQSTAQPRPRPAETQTPTRPAQVPLPTQQNPKVATVSSQQLNQPQQRPAETQASNLIGTASFSNLINKTPFGNSQTQSGCSDDVGCCSNEGCNECQSQCCNYRCCEPKHLFEVGVEAAFLQASLDGAASSLTAFDTLDNPMASVLANSTNGTELVSAPRIWLGVGNGCWGIRGRYFDFRAGDHDFGNPGTLPDALGFAHQMRAYTADVELTRNFCLNSCSGLFSVGARRAMLNSSTNANLVSVIDGDTVTGTANTFREIDGTGVTVGLQGNKPIGNPCHNLSLFGAGRASFLWGDSRAASGTTTTHYNPNGSTAANNFGAAGTDDSQMTITELQLGLQHTRKLKCLPVVAFFRIAAEWQHWEDDSGVQTGANSTSFQTPGAAIQANANTEDQVLDLVGLVLSTGITY